MLQVLLTVRSHNQKHDQTAGLWTVRLDNQEARRKTVAPRFPPRQVCMCASCQVQLTGLGATARV
jgi:hypothetical protein